MASRQRVYTSEDVLDEVFADTDSKYDENSKESVLDDPSSSEGLSEEENANENEEEPSKDEDNFKPQLIPRGRAPTRGARRGPGRRRGGRNLVRRTPEEEQQLLEAKWKAVDRDPNIPDFSATPGIKVPIPDEASAGDFMNLYFTDECFDLLFAQTVLEKQP